MASARLAGGAQLLGHTQVGLLPEERADQLRPTSKESAKRRRSRQREGFDGLNFGAAFFGWLVATGLAVLLIAILGAAAAAIGLTQLSDFDVRDSASTIGIVGGSLLILALAIAYYTGGYVAGRLLRFDGARQGLAAWLFGLVVTIPLAVWASNG
jgi:hypothetical protein